MSAPTYNDLCRRITELIQESCQRRDRLAECEAYARENVVDAERYRWLRAFSGHPLQVMDRNQDAAYYETALDAAIDRERMGDCDTPEARR